MSALFWAKLLKRTFNYLFRKCSLLLSWELNLHPWRMIGSCTNAFSLRLHWPWPLHILETCCSIAWFLFSIIAYNPGVIMWIEIDSDKAHFDIWFRWEYRLDLIVWSLISSLSNKATASALTPESHSWKFKTRSVQTFFFSPPVVQVASFMWQVYSLTWRRLCFVPKSCPCSLPLLTRLVVV